MQRICKSCQSIRIFKTKNGFVKGENKVCRSCSNSISRGGTGNVKVHNNKKKCFACQEIRNIDEFYIYKNGNVHSECQKCKLERFRKYQKEIGRYKKHGINKNIYDSMYKKQLGKCYLCKEKFPSLHIDHNHKNDKVRKLLCRDCNLALGLVKENSTILMNMISYLENENECSK